MLRLTKLANTSSCKSYTYTSCNINLPKPNKASLLRLKNHFTTKNPTPPKKQKKCTENPYTNDKETLRGNSEATQEYATKNNIPPKKQKKCDKNAFVNSIFNDKEKLNNSEAIVDDATINILTRKQKKCNENPPLNDLSNDKGKLIDTSEVTDEDTSRNHTPTKKHKKYIQNSSVNNLPNDKEKLIDTSKGETIYNTKQICPCGGSKQNTLQNFTNEHQHKRGTTHVVCSKCGQWFHTRCINLTKSQGNKLNSHKIPYTCIFCLARKLKHIIAIKDKLSNIISSDEVIQEQQNKESEPSLPIRPNLEDDNVDDSDELHTNVYNCEFIVEVTKETEPISLCKEDNHNNILDKLITNLSSSDIKNMFKQDSSINRITNKEHYIWDDFY